MIHNETVSIKKVCLWCLIVACGIVTVCLVFVSFVSMWTGFSHLQQNGFWVPVLAGTTMLILVLFLFIHATKRILFHMKEEDVLNV